MQSNYSQLMRQFMESLRIPKAEHGDVKIYAYIPHYQCKIVMGVDHSSDNRVLRGGSWINNGRNSRSAMRNNNSPGNRNNNTGFRLARAQYAQV